MPRDLDRLTDELFLLTATEDLNDDDLREAAEGLLPELYTALRQAGYGTDGEDDPDA